MEQWPDRLSSRVLGSTIERRSVTAIATIIVLLGAGFALLHGLGGAHRVPPHWFYLPILFAGLRFGLLGALPTALVATILAGPLTPGDTSAGIPQEFSDWAARGAFFVLIGATLPAMMRRGTMTIRQERRYGQIEAEVRRALAEDEFVLHYQPIIDLDRGQVVGAEALLRWQHPQRGLLSPAEFIEDVERIGSITSWVLADAATTASRWCRSFELDDFYLSVNVSGQNLGQPDFVAQIRAALKAARLDPSRLCIEVTESAMIDDIDHAAARLQVLRSLGVKVAVDDFGAGHATLTYLQQLPLDIIKIDRSFISGLTTRARIHAIVVSLLRLARQLDATCVAEGVETEDQRDALMRNGCTQAQGYLFARPMPASEFEQMITRTTDVPGWERRPGRGGPRAPRSSRTISSP